MERKTSESILQSDGGSTGNEHAFIHYIAQKLRNEEDDTMFLSPVLADGQYFVDANGLTSEIKDWAEDMYDAEITQMAGVLVLRFSNGERFCLHIKKLHDKSLPLS